MNADVVRLSIDGGTWGRGIHVVVEPWGHITEEEAVIRAAARLLGNLHASRAERNIRRALAGKDEA